MNGCDYCVIVHGRKRHGRKRARGRAMCLAQDEMRPCGQYAHMRGERCHIYRAKRQREGGTP